MHILVITPTLGTSPWLEETVASVSSLSVKCTHVLVAPASAVDGLASRFPSTVVMAEPGGGMYAAINTALRAGLEWDAFTYINDDDLLMPDFVRVVACLSRNPAGAAYGGVRLIGARGQRLGAIPISLVPSLNRLLYAQRVEPVYQHGTVFSRALFERMGLFDEAFRFCGDTEYMARACVAGLPFVCATARPVAAFRLRAGQLTKNLPLMRAESDQVHLKLGLPAKKIKIRHRLARLIFCFLNAPIYLERIYRHGFITFGEVLAKVE